MIYRVFAPCVLNLIRPTDLGIKFNTDVSRGCARIKFNTIRIKFNTDDSIQVATPAVGRARLPFCMLGGSQCFAFPRIVHSRVPAHALGVAPVGSCRD